MGWITTRFATDGSSVALYAAHKEQVTRLPQGAGIVARTKGCEIGGFPIADHILTIQYHPEMTHEFVTAFLNAFEDEIGHEVTQKAAQTLAQPTDITTLAE